MNIKLKKLLEHNHSNLCLFSKDILKNLSLSEGENYNIYLGQSSELCTLGIYEEEEGIIAIPQNMFDKFSIFDGISLNIRKENNEIHLGPVVGIFINYKEFSYFENDEGKNEGKAAISEDTLCYYFSINDIDWNEGRVKGYNLVPKTEKWELGWFPLPDVIYDRGVNFKEKEKPLVKELRKIFRNNPNIKMINRKNALGKREIYKKLSKFPEVYRFLPDTVDYTRFEDLLAMIVKYKFIFLKASYGSGAKKVLSIEKEEQGFRIIFYSKELKSTILNNVEDLRKYVEKYTEEESFIIQQGIRLLKYHGSVFDLRILTIKDGKGKWKVMSYWGRIAPENFTITNYSAGGGLEYYENMYPHLIHSFPKVEIPEEKEVGRVTLMIAEYIEKAFGRFGELGMDIAIDMEGKIWLIEANTKPNKDLVEGYDDLYGVNLQDACIFEYAKFLSEFNK